MERNDSHRQIDTSINRFDPNWLISWMELILLFLIFGIFVSQFIIQSTICTDLWLRRGMLGYRITIIVRIDLIISYDRLSRAILFP